MAVDPGHLIVAISISFTLHSQLDPFTVSTRELELVKSQKNMVKVNAIDDEKVRASYLRARARLVRQFPQ